MADAEPVNPLVGGVSEPSPTDTARTEDAAPEPKQYDYSVTYKAGEESQTVTGHVLAIDDEDAQKQVTSKYENATYERKVVEKVSVQSVTVKVSGESPIEGDTSVSDTAEAPKK